jgi:hypothetical protein
MSVVKLRGNMTDTIPLRGPKTLPPETSHSPEYREWYIDAYIFWCDLVKKLPTMTVTEYNCIPILIAANIGKLPTKPNIIEEIIPYLEKCYAVMDAFCVSSPREMLADATTIMQALKHAKISSLLESSNGEE